MLISCPKCHSVYEIPDDLVPRSGQNFRWSACSNVWNVIPSDAFGYREEDNEDIVVEALEVSEPPYRKYPADKDPYSVVQDNKSGKKTRSSKEVVEEEGDKNYVMVKPKVKKKKELTLTSDLGTSFTISMGGDDVDKDESVDVKNEIVSEKREIKADKSNRLEVKKTPKMYVKTKMFLWLCLIVWALLFFRNFWVMLWGGFEGYYNKVGLSGYDNYHKLSFENLRVSDEKKDGKTFTKIVADVVNNAMFATKVSDVKVKDKKDVFKPKRSFLKAKEKTEVEILLEENDGLYKAYKIEFVK